MIRSFNLAMLCLVALLVIRCNTYYVASSDTPVDIYSDEYGTSVAFNAPVKSLLLLKGKSSKYGFTRVRYHLDPTWYWVSPQNLSLVPDFNPKQYNQSYINTEAGLNLGINTGNGSIGYDATIQTGSRGGKYYINKNGNKTYVPRSTPSGTTKRVGGKGSRGGKH